MKRIFLVAITALMFITSLSACTKSADKESATESAKPKSESKSSAKENKKEKDDVKEENKKAEDNKKTKAPDYSFTEMLAVDNDECIIKITGIEEDPIWKHRFNVYFENKTSDKDLTFTVVSGSIDGIEFIPTLYSTVPAGKQTNGSVCFIDSELDEAEEDYAFSDIELTFLVTEAENYFADSVAKETVHIYPYGKDKAVKYERKPKTSDQVILDNEYAKVVAIGGRKSDIDGYDINLFVVNKYDDDIIFAADKLSVDGFAMSAYSSGTILKGNCRFVKLGLLGEDLKNNKIDKIENIDLHLNIMSSDFMEKTYYDDMASFKLQ